MTKAYYTVQQAEYLCKGREKEVLERVAGLPSELLDGKNHPCPLCGGTDRFRLINPGEGTVFCNQCFQEKNHGYLAAVMHFRQVTFPEALKLVITEFNGQSIAESRPAPASRTKKLNDKKYEFATTFTPYFTLDGRPKAMRKSCFAVGRKPWGMDLAWNGYSYIAPEPNEKSKVKKHTVYEYTDGLGAPCQLVYRIDFKDGKKIPALYHWNGSVYEAGKPDGVPVPFNAVRLKEVSQVYIVEGEKCAVALQWWLDSHENSAESAVTCFSGGSGQFLDDYKRWFQGKEIFLYPDNDEPGAKYARVIYEALKGIASRIRVWKWPEGTPEKWDVADEIREKCKLCRVVQGCAGYEKTNPAQNSSPENPPP